MKRTINLIDSSTLCKITHTFFYAVFNINTNGIFLLRYAI
ncbi:hypothetical protein BAZSYMA_ACONTIG41858_5 [Bathymodiolus azoricus thioautotrophic gill symbiont]|uniref:Uncharacterized protein n=1 Tax=Bathymodiolus azoricus thioautotrophic gill symbiont TaxID=235205 RepID=A0A1H6LY05_9GAMM|nr:hypothetical protein BAZSYMA_ACONTIG41858_5 [Bathymodiolus azoricus thioautotrophic gill symbiont]